MDRQTNERLKDLDRRLKQVYKAAEETATQRLAKAVEHLRQFELAPDVPVAYRQQALHMHMLRVDRETGVLQNMASDISRSGDLAGRMVQNESLNTFQGGYRSAVNEIKGQIGRIGIDVSWSEIDRPALNALFNGDQTPIGNIPGYRGGFEQVKSRQVYDRRMGRYYFERALGRLGDNPDIVRRLQNQLSQSLLLGESIPQMATRIRAVTQGCRMQAVRIARTECLRALNQGKMIGYYQAKEMGIPLKKKWIATSDERTRDTHNDLMGETQELDAAFSNGLIYPLDPSGPPEEVIHCRCICVCVVQINELQKSFTDTENGVIINNPLEQAHPVDVSYGTRELSARQQELLNKLPGTGSSHTFRKNEVSMLDLSALTANTKNEFAMFTAQGSRTVFRGNVSTVDISLDDLTSLKASGARLSGHTHVGTNLVPSKEDIEALQILGQKRSVIYNELGRYSVYP